MASTTGSTRTGKESSEEKKESRLAKELSDLFMLYKEFKEMKPVGTAAPSSTFLQIVRYGQTFKRVVESVDYDLSKFYQLYGELDKYGKFTETYRSTIYRHKWTEADVKVPKEDVEHIVEPLAAIGLGDFKFKQELKYNEKYYEAISRYAEEGRVSGKVVFDENKKALIVISEVVGQPKGRYAVHDTHYTMLVLEPGRAVFSCSCPWSRGETTDSRGKNFEPEYTSLCKHGIALLYYYYPEIATYVKLASENRLTKRDFDREVVKIREVFEEVRKRLDEYISKHPDSKPVVVCNVGYIMTKELYSRIRELGTFHKFVPDTEHLDKMVELWNSVAIVRKTDVSYQTSATNQPKYDITPVLKKLEGIGLFDRISELRNILNGLQGARSTTLYTSALIAGLVLGSDLETSPTLVSVVGDPGTGKTLTAEGFVRLVGVRSIVIEKDVEENTIKEELATHLSKNLSRYIEFFEKVVTSKVPSEKRDEAKKFFEEFIEASKGVLVETSAKKMVELAKGFAETFAKLYGIDSKRTKLAIAKLFYSVLKLHIDVYKKYVNKEAVKTKALEVRREMLQELARAGLINRPEDKEEFNGGAVRWEALETVGGIKVRVIVDLHYALRKFDGDVNRLMEFLDNLEKSYKVYFKSEVPGIAEVKMSESEYLEKALKVREEDILSPAKKLIWVGGELTKRAIILIDESRRAPWVLESLLTELSMAGKDMRRTNLVVTTDNAGPLMEAESNSNLDAFNSRINFEAVTPSTTVSTFIRESLDKISQYEREGKIPLVYMDEMLLLNFLSNYVEVPERYEILLHSIPMLLTYDIKILRPETVEALMKGSEWEKVNAPPLILISPKGEISNINVGGDYVDLEWGGNMPAIRMMPERRFAHHVERAAKALAITNKKTVVDDETFFAALGMVLLARVAPVERQSPYLYLINKIRAVNTIIKKAREFLSKSETATEKLIDVLGSFSVPTPELLNEALNEMVNNPVAAAVFVRFLVQMLASEESASKFMGLSKKIPGLYKTLSALLEYERLLHQSTT